MKQNERKLGHQGLCGGGVGLFLGTLSLGALVMMDTESSAVWKTVSSIHRNGLTMIDFVEEYGYWFVLSIFFTAVWYTLHHQARPGLHRVVSSWWKSKQTKG